MSELIRYMWFFECQAIIPPDVEPHVTFWGKHTMVLPFHIVHTIGSDRYTDFCTYLYGLKNIPEKESNPHNIQLLMSGLEDTKDKMLLFKDGALKGLAAYEIFENGKPVPDTDDMLQQELGDYLEWNREMTPCRVMNLHTLSVIEKNQGYGSQIIHDLKNYCRWKGIGTMHIMSCYGDVVAFYHKQGFNPRLDCPITPLGSEGISTISPN